MTSLLSYIWHHCWHDRFTWPRKNGKHSYQVCLDCGARRRYDMKTMQHDFWWRKEGPRKPARRRKRTRAIDNIVSISPAPLTAKQLAKRWEEYYAWNALQSKP